MKLEIDVTDNTFTIDCNFDDPTERPEWIDWRTASGVVRYAPMERDD